MNLPLYVSGNASAMMNLAGTATEPSLPWTRARKRPSSVALSVAPGWRTRKATGTVPSTSSGMPTTAQLRSDDPALTVRDWHAPEGTPPAQDPLRVVLGTAVANARVQSCLSWDGPIDRLLEHLGDDGVVQLMVEGGAQVIGDFHRAGLIDRFVLYQAPVLFGGDDAKGLFTGAGAPSITAVDRGEIVSVERVGADLRIEFKPGV